ncbi:Glutathione S-transferase 1 [Phytophthora cinnamomi]|uniref:Glutathione S-transferase 1 n=1 Tax=Phytophthora cinnamomi TaxID=4785 RepID=UPI003559A3B2|nr:Glutathione S-transferase 1 [Phytophthora cinnamomi]
MSVTAADSSSSALALNDELHSPPPSDSFAKSSQQSLRRQSKALSISSLSDESSKGGALQHHSVSSKAVATEACRDVERELAAIETRLSVFRGRRRHIDSGPTLLNAVAPGKVKIPPNQPKEQLAVSPTPSVSSNTADASSPIFSKLSKAQQEAGAVADQVATTLMKCDQLLQRVKSCDVSRVSSTTSTKEKERSLRANSKARKVYSSSRHSESMLSDSMVSSGSSQEWGAKNRLDIEDEEALLAQKAAAVKSFAARCQRDIETSTTKIELHHKQMQTNHLKELQRKYDSKKHMTLMALRERYEAETKALVRAKMEEYEFEEATAVKKTRVTLLEDRNRVLQELQSSHNAAMEESLSQLELQLTSETEREKRELERQLQEELSLRLKQMQEDSREALSNWEVEQRQKLEQELYEHREAAVSSVLKAQEERTAELKHEIQSSHTEKEEVELQKLKKALAFGAQAQLQQLRKRLEMEHEEKTNDIKTQASVSLEKETEELKQMLTRSHSEQQQQLLRDLEKKNRVAIMELHDSMQTSHRESLEALKDAAERGRADALVKHRQDFELECRQELQVLQQTLDQEVTTKLRQLEMDHAEECELKLEQLRMRAVNQHARELETKRSRMIQCKNVLLAEATAFLSFDNNLSESSVDNRDSQSKTYPENDSAASHLLELKKHLSKELAQYVDVMVTEFDELAEEQQILVAKITESTQLYLSFKRQCGVLEAQSVELTSGLETLHDQLQQKDAVCKKLYQANEALLKRLQTRAFQASIDSNQSEPPSPPAKHPPTFAKTLRSTSSWK